jgi:superfamily II DNA or RNA helicase
MTNGPKVFKRLSGIAAIQKLDWQWSESQQKALERMLKAFNIFLAGEPGAGKTTLVGSFDSVEGHGFPQIGQCEVPFQK